MMRSPFVRAAILVLLLASLTILAACRRNDSSPTASAGTPAAGTSLPVVPTVPILTALPTFAPLPTTSGGGTIPTVTPLRPSPIPTANQSGGGAAALNATPRAGGNVYITRLRLAPEVARNKEDVTFFAVFNNSTGKEQQSSWCVEVFRPGERKSFGITRCNVKAIPNAVSEQATSGWQIAGIRECVPVRARAVVRDDQDQRTPFLQPNGQDLWLDFTACP